MQKARERKPRWDLRPVMPALISSRFAVHYASVKRSIDCMSRLIVALVSVLLAPSVTATAQTQTGGAIVEVVERQVAPDLYFLYDRTSSNSAFLVTDDGVLVVDTRHHPRDGQDLLNRIRRITGRPVRWVINTHF